MDQDTFVTLSFAVCIALKLSLKDNFTSGISDAQIFTYVTFFYRLVAKLLFLTIA